MAASDTSAFKTANPHALSCILEAAETRNIIAATDIFDAQGIKLWAAKQPVSAELQKKLANREVREPLESSLIAKDGVHNDDLVKGLRAIAEGGSALTPLVKPYAAKLERIAATLPLQPVVQLLLTATQAARPVAYQHAIHAMALNGALAATSGAEETGLLPAMIAGLVHDLGEMYIGPRMGEADADREMDFVSYQQLVVHPHVGHLLIKQLTNYPTSVATAVAEHHERLDGSGYPRALTAKDISPAGKLLAVTEAALAALRDPSAPLLHASIALRAVPGEFDPVWVGRISAATYAQPESEAVMEPADIRARLGALESLLGRAEREAEGLKAGPGTPGFKQAADLAAYLLWRIRLGWNESGLWSVPEPGSMNAAEVEAIEDELYRRLRGVQRATLMRAGEALPVEEMARLRGFCDGLAMEG